MLVAEVVICLLTQENTNNSSLTKKEKDKHKAIKKAPFFMGVLFTVLGIIFLVLVFSANEATASTYAVLAVALLGFGVTYLDKSKILDR